MQHLVWRGVDARHEVGWAEGDLLHFGEVVVRVSVQGELTDRDQRVVGLRPHLGDVEWIERSLLGLLVGHDLDVEGPARVLAAGDGVVQVADAVVRVVGGQLVGAVHVQVLDLLVRLVVELAVVRLRLGVDELESVRSVAVHVAIAVRDAAVREQHAHLVGGLRAQGDEVPEHVRVLQVGGRVALLGVDEAREEDRVADEEDRRVVADQIPDSVLGVELDGESARVADGVGRAALTPDGREANGDRGALSDLAEHLRSGVLLDVRVGHLEVAEGAGSLGVHHALWDALAVEVGNLVQELDILQEERASLANRLSRIFDIDRSAGRCCQDRFFL